MTLLNFAIAVASADGVGESDRVWFPKWLQRYAMTFPKGLTDELAVNRDTTLVQRTGYRVVFNQLAVVGQVAASTQTQAQSSLLFLYECTGSCFC